MAVLMTDLDNLDYHQCFVRLLDTIHRADDKQARRAVVQVTGAWSGTGRAGTGDT